MMRTATDAEIHRFALEMDEILGYLQPFQRAELLRWLASGYCADGLATRRESCCPVHHSPDD